MSDLLALLGGEWAPAPPPSPQPLCTSEDRLDATHGCPACGRAPTVWSEAYGGYLDGMGRFTRCSYCAGCIGTGRTALRDPWTDELVAWNGAPCISCQGTGYNHHRWDCDGQHGHLEPRGPQRVEAFGVTFDGRSFVVGEVA